MPRLHTEAVVRARRHCALVSLAALFALTAALLVSLAPKASAAETAISEGQLEWSLKESWRKYIGIGSKVGDGAQVTEWLTDSNGESYPEGFTFPVAGGSFDDETSTTILQLDGYVHFQSWEGLIEPGKFALDTKFSDLEIEISPTAQVLRGTHTGYHRTDPGGELHVDEDVVLAKFDISGATTSFEGGVSKWSEIPTVAGPGFSIYGESTLLDDTSFAYSGPGGIPDLGEKWDTPGAPGLESEGVWLADLASGARVLYPSDADGVVHTVDLVAPSTNDAKLLIAAYDAETLTPVGTPYVWTFPGATPSDTQHLRTAFDPETDSVFFVTYHDGAGHDEATVRRVVWEGGSESYADEMVGSLGSAPSGHRQVTALAWNSVEDELAAIAYSGSEADPYATDLLHRFRLQSGAWTHQQTVLRAPDTGEFADASWVTSPWGVGAGSEPDEKSLAVARDGSYVSASSTAYTEDSGGGIHYYPALHIVVEAGGSATVEPIAGTTTPRTIFGTYYGFLSLSEDVDGSLLLHNSSQVMDAYARIDVAGGVAAKVGEIVDAPVDAFPPYEVSGFANSMAADAARGIVWATDPYDPEGYRLNALDGEEIVGRYVYTDFPISGGSGAFGRLAVGPDGSVYLPIEDADSARLGYRRLAFTGVVPEVTTQPQSRSVTLGVGEASEPAEFSVAVADADDSVQWQSKAPGETAFSDVAGGTETTLTVEATPVSDGTSYRAKVSNEAGAIVSDTAMLSVEYAPLIVSDVASRGVTEGADALFLLSADGNPEPTVSWQRRVDGFWQNIAPEDENFVLNGPSLTVLDTNVEQSGALFRAKLTNAVGSVFSKSAKLTVNPTVAIPPEGLDLENVSLEWTGSAEMQKVPFFGDSNFFSAGLSDGEEASYDAVGDNAAVYQVSSSGTETIATWETRAAHVASGGVQLVRLHGGEARIEPDGSASVEWDGSWSVNFYGGLVPFTFTDPELVVDADGAGTLSADMSGCESSQANPSECTPFASVPDVTVATFSGVEVDPAGAVEIAPDYAGVEVTVPIPFTPQNRVVSGWGAWPQPFVDFQVKTGLSSHWYSSGGSFDPYKEPDPFTVDFDGEAPPVEPDPVSKPTPPGQQTKPPAGGSTPSGDPLIASVGKTQAVGRGRLATIATLTCTGEGFCAVGTPSRVKLRIARRAHWAKVIAPRTLDAGDTAAVKVRLSKAAFRVLNRRIARGRIAVSVRSQAGSARRAIAVKIRKGGKLKGDRKTGPVGVGGPQSGPISAEPPLLTRPASAVDVESVEVSWAPRDSWVRYASSGVAAGDGILLSNGAVGVDSTASPCLDRPSTSDAQLPYSIEFAPKASWYDAASGVAGIYGQGSVSFRWAAHSIDLTASDPEIEIAGAGSRAIFRFSGSGGTAYPDQRASLVSLDLSGQPIVSNDGKTFAYNLKRGTLTADGVNVFAGFYTPPDNDEFGCVSVEFTVP